MANLPVSWSAAALLYSGTYTAPPIQFVVVALHVLILPFGLFTCACATQILAVASIWAVTISFRCGNNSRVVTNRQQRLIEQILYAVTCVHFHLKHTIKWLKQWDVSSLMHIFKATTTSNASWVVSREWRWSQYILSLSSWYFYHSIFLFSCRAISLAQVLMHVCYCMGRGAMWYPRNHIVL